MIEVYMYWFIIFAFIFLIVLIIKEEYFTDDGYDGWWY